MPDQIASACGDLLALSLPRSPFLAPTTLCEGTVKLDALSPFYGPLEDRHAVDARVELEVEWHWLYMRTARAKPHSHTESSFSSDHIFSGFTGDSKEQQKDGGLQLRGTTGYDISATPLPALLLPFG